MKLKTFIKVALCSLLVCISAFTFISCDLFALQTDTVATEAEAEAFLDAKVFERVGDYHLEIERKIKEKGASSYYKYTSTTKYSGTVNYTGEKIDSMEYKVKVRIKQRKYKDGSDDKGRLKSTEKGVVIAKPDGGYEQYFDLSESIKGKDMKRKYEKLSLTSDDAEYDVFFADFDVTDYVDKLAGGIFSTEKAYLYIDGDDATIIVDGGNYKETIRLYFESDLIQKVEIIRENSYGTSETTVKYKTGHAEVSRPKNYAEYEE